MSGKSKKQVNHRSVKGSIGARGLWLQCRNCFWDPTFDLNDHFFEQEQAFSHKNNKIGIYHETKHLLLEKGAVATTAFGVFFIFATPLAF